jgi:hypothetical protein
MLYNEYNFASPRVARGGGGEGGPSTWDHINNASVYEQFSVILPSVSINFYNRLWLVRMMTLPGADPVPKLTDA